MYKQNRLKPGLEVIKLDYILKLKIKRADWQPIIALYFEFETVLKFHDLLPITIYLLYRGSYMSAHVLLNLLNELGKRYKMRGLSIILSLFRS